MKQRSSSILLVLCIAAVVFGAIQLMNLRFEEGDLYPEYSSFRADPLGTMALFESVARLNGFTVERDLSITGELPDPKGVTYLHLATTESQWKSIPPNVAEQVEQFAKGGARLVMTMYPQSRHVERRTPPLPEIEEEEPAVKPVSIWAKWGLSLKVVNLTLDDEGTFKPVPVAKMAGPELPDALDWHSGVVFDKIDGAWKSIYERDGKPVVIERQFGAGSLVIATDSYFLSNEALHDARHSNLLAWMIGPNRRIVFDEAHLGVTEQPGLAALMRRYRLHGFVASLLLLGGLFVWKNATSLVPVRKPEASEAYIAGRDAASGFVNLLRRNIPVRDILNTCYTEWKKTAAQSGSYSAPRLQQAEAAYTQETLKPAKEKDPVSAYKTIATILNKKP